MAVIDCFTYNGERDLLDIRLNILSPYVDKFLIVEAKTTFSGYKKPLYFAAQEQYFEKWWKKISYHIIDEDYTDAEMALAYASPNTVGATHWKNEFLQKESIHKALRKQKLQNDDIIYLGDVDEIWVPSEVTTPMKLKLKVYAYYLNNASSEPFWGTLVARYEDLKGRCLNHLRSDISLRSTDAKGWHFTSMGGYKEVSRKLNDSYTSESYNTYDTQLKLPERVEKGIDYLGRNFTFTLDESQWPLYLTNNRKKYAHLCK